MIRISLALLLFSQLASATDITVCASGCTTTSLQTAFTNAARGDTITMRAGETFEGSFSLPYKSGGGTITVRSSRLAELPAPGNRVGSAHTAYMPKIQPTDGTISALTIGYNEQYVSSVNTSTDTITFTGATGFSDTDPVACWNDDGTIPVVANQVYYVRDSTSTTIKLANLPGGAVVDLTSTPTATRFRCTIARSISGWTFQGIEFSVKSGTSQLYNLIEFTNEATARAGISTGFIFDRVYIHGIYGQNGPRTCLFLDAAAFTLTDSTIENCNKEGEEGHGIAGVQSPGPLLIKNNYIAGGSINIIFGGEYVRINNLVNGDSGGAIITGNYFVKPLNIKYLAGTGGTAVPSASCTDYDKYLRTTTGVLYNCLSNVWSVAGTCGDGEYYRRTDVTQDCGSGACWKCASSVYVTDTVYRGASYFVKNLFEMKNVTNFLVQGNVFENCWSGNGDQAGFAVWPISQVGQYNANGWVRGQDIRFVNNIIKTSEQGIHVASEGGTTFGVPNSRVVVKNNVGIGIGQTSVGSISGGGLVLSTSGRCDNCVMDHNTMYPGSAGASAGGIVFDGTYLNNSLYFANNLTPRNTYGVRGNSGGECTGIADVVGSGSQLLNTAMIDQLSGGGLGSIGSCATNFNYVAGPWSSNVTSSTDMTLQATSPYSASCASGCSYTSTDGTDLGADVAMVNGLTGGATTGLPWMGGSVRVVLGSTRAVVSYTAPDSSACNLKLYTNLARTTLAADTADSSKWVDTRTGNITAGTSRQFVLGTVSALTASTQYWGVISCGTSVSVQSIRTLAAGSGTYNIVTRLGTATTGQYSSSADMSSPTSLSSSTTHTVPISTGNVRYYQQTGGAISAFVAP